MYKAENLDTAVQKFKAYCQGNGDYDELDFKSDLIQWRDENSIMPVIEAAHAYGKVIFTYNNRAYVLAPKETKNE